MAQIPETNLSHPVKINSLDSDKNFTHILHGENNEYFAKWAGHLSLKSFTNGQAFYNVGAGHYAVNDDSYLILNQMQPYSITIDSDTNVESFCIFFEAGFAEEVNYSLLGKTNKLLDNPDSQFSSTINFIQKMYPRASIAAVLSELKYFVRQRETDNFWLNEKLHELMQKILLEHHKTLIEIEKIPALRQSTREELYRRIYRARDFIEACYNLPLTIDEIAKIACLSPNHFLRTFKRVFRQSPHQYLTDLRLKKSRKLLKETNLPIIAVCQSVGFESHASFSLLFRRRFGSSPQSFRHQKGVFE